MTAAVRLIVSLVLFVGVGLQCAAAGERRVALIIGNSKYAATDTLPNPGNDARVMTDVLGRLGFEVTAGNDLTAPDLSRLVHSFVQKLGSSDVALFFYAGHGLQYQGRNFMVGTEAQLADEATMPFETVSLDLVIELIERTAKTTIVLYDACRNNPLARSFRSKLKTVASKRSGGPIVGTGAAPVEARMGDTLIVFSATPGSEASDGTEGNSPFTASLAKHIETPGLEVEVMLKRVTAEVRTVTNDTQTPERLSQLIREFYFKDATVEVAQAEPAPSGVEEELRRKIRELEEKLEASKSTVIAAAGTREPGQGKAATPGAAEPADAPPKAEPPPQPPALAKTEPVPTAPEKPAETVAAAPAPAAAPSPPAATPALALGGAVLKADATDGIVTRSLGFARDGGSLFTAGDDGVLRFWDPATFALSKDVAGMGGRNTRATISSDGSLMAVGGADKRVRVLKLPGGEQMAELPVQSGRVYGLAFSMEKPPRYVAAGDGEGEVVLWDLKRNKSVGRPKSHQGPAHAVSYYPGDTSTFLTAGGDGTIKVYSFKDGTRTIQAHRGGVFFASYVGNGDTILSAGADRTLKLWNSKGLGQVRSFEGHAKYILTAAISPDGRLIASGGGDKAVLLWEAESGRLLRRLLGHRQDVEALAFTPDGKRLVSSSEDKTIKVWDVASGEELLTHIIAKDGAYATAAQDGRYAASATGERLLTLSTNGIDGEISEDYRAKHLQKSGIAIATPPPVSQSAAP